MKTALDIFFRIFLSSKAMLSWAGAIVIAFAILHALGWREYTSVLSGTIPNGSTPVEASAKALAYMAAYFGSVLVAPILLITTVIRFGLERLVEVSKGVR